MARPGPPPQNPTVSIRLATSRPQAVRAYLAVIEERTSSVFHLPAEGEVTIGRSEEARLCIHDSGASRQHARLSIGGGEIRLRDLRSHNGTLVNGERLSGPCTPSSGDTITICNTLLVL